MSGHWPLNDEVESCSILVVLLQDCLSPLSMQALPAAPESLCVVEMGGHDVTRDDVEGVSQSGLFLNIGLQVRYLFIAVVLLCEVSK